jgi:hypothetical protein
MIQDPKMVVVLLADGRYSEVVVYSGLAVHLKSILYLEGFSQLNQIELLVLRIMDNKRPSLGVDDAREKNYREKK